MIALVMDVLTLAFAVVLVVAAVVIGRRYGRTQRALRAPIGSDACVACAGTQITTFAPECHRCDGCGFVWGDGLAAKAARDRSAKIEALGPAKRRDFAIAELKAGDARLGAAEVALDHAKKQLTADVLVGGGWGDGDMYSRARSEGMVTAASEMGLAQKHIRNAAEATGWTIDPEGEHIDFHHSVLALDAFFDSMIIDVAGHLQVEKLSDQAAAMRRSVDRALSMLREAPATATLRSAVEPAVSGASGDEPPEELRSQPPPEP
jgi:hypothetical protein